MAQTKKSNGEYPKVTKKFVAALGDLLGEFGAVDLEPRCEYFRSEGEDFEAEALEEAFAVAEQWYGKATGEKLWFREPWPDESDERADA